MNTPKLPSNLRADRFVRELNQALDDQLDELVRCTEGVTTLEELKLRIREKFAIQLREPPTGTWMQEVGRIAVALGAAFALAKVSFRMRLRGVIRLSTGHAGARTMRTATLALDLLSMLVPKRISNEEIGDALEQIHAMVKARRPRWFIYVKVVTTFFWVGVHTGLHYAERIAGIIGKATGGKGD